MAALASDLRLNPSFSTPVEVWGEGATLDAIKQRLTVALSVQLGEWAKDITYGIDWIGALSTRPFPLDALLIAIKRQALTVGGVIAVEELEGAEQGAGALAITGVVITVAGVLALETDSLPVVSPTLGAGPWFRLYPRGGRSAVI